MSTELTGNRANKSKELSRVKYLLTEHRAQERLVS
jgi:hypothetical protein